MLLNKPAPAGPMERVQAQIAELLPECLPPPDGTCPTRHFMPESHGCIGCATQNPQAYQWCFSIVSFRNRVWSIVVGYWGRFPSNPCLLDSPYGIGPLAAMRAMEARELAAAAQRPAAPAQPPARGSQHVSRKRG